jgi:hypothetical protein
MKPVEILIKHRHRIQQIYLESGSWLKTYETLSSEIQEVAEMSVETFKQYAEIMIEFNKSLNRDEELTAVKHELEQVKQELKKIHGVNAAVKQGVNISGWSIQESKGYFRAFRKMGGKMYAVYLGKTLENAETKIELKEQQITRVNRAEKKELKSKVFEGSLKITEHMQLYPE